MDPIIPGFPPTCLPGFAAIVSFTFQTSLTIKRILVDSEACSFHLLGLRICTDKLNVFDKG